MAKDWKDKTCESCEYRLDYRCYRFPPRDYFILVASIVIRGWGGYYHACAEYKERLDG